MSKKWRIEFGDIRLGKTSLDNLIDCHKRGWPSGGPKVIELEENWGKVFDYKYNKAVSSGTDAVICAISSLHKMGAKRGDEVIVPALSFIATSNAVLVAGFIPVFVDVEIETLNINPSKIQEKITPKTKGIIAVSTMGKPPKVDQIRDIADKNKMLFVCDNAEGHGCTYQGKYMGHWADASTYSMYAAHVVCAGEGGMVSTNNKEISDSVNSIRTHGRKNGDLFFNHEVFGINAKMNDLEASVGLEGVENFWWTFDTRKKNLNKMLELTKDLEQYAWFNLEEEGEVTCPHAFTVTVKDPKFDSKGLYEFLEDRGIKCKRNFGCIPTQHAAFSWMGHTEGEFPASEYVGTHGLHFGCHQYLTDDDLVFASDCLHDYFKKF